MVKFIFFFKARRLEYDSSTCTICTSVLRFGNFLVYNVLVNPFASRLHVSWAETASVEYFQRNKPAREVNARMKMTTRARCKHIL